MAMDVPVSVNVASAVGIAEVYQRRVYDHLKYLWLIYCVYRVPTPTPLNAREGR